MDMPTLHVYDRHNQLQNDPTMLSDPDVLEFVGHDHIDQFYPRGSAPSEPPPPYEPISYPLPSPLPSPAFPPSTPFTPAGSMISERGRPVPETFLHDPAFSPDPRSNPHFIMNFAEHIHAAPPPPPRDSRYVSSSLQAGSVHPHAQHVRSHSTTLPPPTPRAPLRDVVPPPPLSQAPPPTPTVHHHIISASSLFPIHPMWHPPVPSTPSTDSGSSFSSHSSPSPLTPGASLPSSASSSPRHSATSSISHTSTSSSVYSDRDKPIPPIPVQSAEAAPVRIQGPPRSSSLARPSRTPAQAPPPLPKTNGTTNPTTARPVPPFHSESAPELRPKPPPPQALSRSATAPIRPATQSQSQSQSQPQAQPPSRSQSQSQPREQQRGRSREQQPQPPQGVQRARSRRPSVGAPRDLDRIDELDETDPRGLAWHHGGPYEVARSVSQKRRDALAAAGDVSVAAAAGASAQRQRSHSRERERPAPRRKPSSSSFSVEPGQIFPAAALYQAMQAPYMPPASQSQPYHSPFDSYNPDSYNSMLSQDTGPRLQPQEQFVYTSGAPPQPSQQPVQDAHPPRTTTRLHKQSRSRQPQQQHHPFPSQPEPQAQAPPQQMRTPAPPVIPMPPPPTASAPVRPPLQQRPSQRSQVRFESPSRPEVRPPAGQGSVDEDAYGGYALDQPPAPSPVPMPMPSQRPSPTSTDGGPRYETPAPPPKPQSRPTSMYPAGNSSTGNLQNEPVPRPDIPLPPRRSAPSMQSKTSLPPRHIPRQLVMPAPLQPLEDQRKAEAARYTQQTQVPPTAGLSTRSDDGHAMRTDVHAHGGRHSLRHHSVSYSRQSTHANGPNMQAPQMDARQYSQGRAQAIPMSGPNVLRKRGTNTASVAGPELASSSASAALFAARVVEPAGDRTGPGKPKVVERVATAVWTRDRAQQEQLEKEAVKEKKIGRKLSKFSRR